jgi:hypothetical protein
VFIAESMAACPDVMTWRYGRVSTTIPAVNNTVAPRSLIVANMEPIVQLEKQAAEVLSKVEYLVLIGGADHVLGELKESYDVYYVYHRAAAVVLAQGDLESYRAYVDLAQKELGSMTQLIRQVAQE